MLESTFPFIEKEYKDKKYKFEFDNRAIILLEGQFNTKISKIAEVFENIGAEDIFKLIYCALYKHHKMDLDEILDTFDFKDIEDITKTLTDCMMKFMPAAKETKTKKK